MRSLLRVLSTLGCVVVGAALGYLLLRLTDHLGGTWITWGLGGAAVCAAGVLVLALPLRLFQGLRHEPSTVLAAVALGPLLGAACGGWLGHARPAWLPEAVVQELQALGVTLGWQSGMVLGGIVGLLLVVYLAHGPSWLAGALFGLVPGAFVGAVGDWSAGVWFVSPVVGALLVMLLVRGAVLAAKARPPNDGSAFAVGGILVGAIVGGLLCGGCGLLIGPLSSLSDGLGLSYSVKATVVDVLSVPNAVAHLLDLPGGWLGGALAGAVVGAVVAAFVAAPPPLDVLCGAALGVADYFTDGWVFAQMFGDWRMGALSGSLICAVTFRMVAEREMHDRFAAAAVWATTVGAAAGALVASVGHGVSVSVGLGAAGGLFASRRIVR